MGQICREGMDESGILPKARYAMTVCHRLEQLLVCGDGARPPVGPGGEAPEAPAILQYTVPKNAPPPQKKPTFLVHFICVLHTNSKEKFIKIEKNLCARQIFQPHAQ